MKFLKINVKVLLILCLFSGILFLSTGCGDKEKTEEEKKTEQVDKKETDKKEENKTETDSKTEETTATKESSSDTSKTSTTKTTDYSVWTANTTINTDKNQKSYKVIWGDTLWLISTAWDVSYQEIATYNHIPNPDLIYVDQIIYNPLFK